MIDTHCHLTDNRLHAQLNFVLTRAAFAGVTRMITIGTGLEESQRCVELCRGHDNLRCAVGVHPSYVDDENFEDLFQLKELQTDAVVVAIGEIGLDYHRGRENRQKQIDFLQYQLNLAKQATKPVVIHCREAVEDCLAVLTDFPGLKMVFHCFTGTAIEARRILERGCLIGFTGVITFKNSSALREVVQLTPMDRLLIETDAPYLTPDPMRSQKINEPAMVMHVAAKVGELKRLPMAEVERITTENAERFFNWPAG